MGTNGKCRYRYERAEEISNNWASYTYLKSDTMSLAQIIPQFK